MHCSRVFRSSAPSDLLPSSPGGRPSGTAQGECGSTRSMEWGVGPGGRVSMAGRLPGPVRSQGRVARCAIQNWSHVLSAARRAWDRHGNNGMPPLAGSGPGHGHRASRLEPRRASRPGNRPARRVAAGPADERGSAACQRVACRSRSRLLLFPAPAPAPALRLRLRLLCAWLATLRPRRAGPR